MQKEIIQDLEKAYLEVRYSNTYVVRVKIEDVSSEYLLHIIRDILFELGFSDNEVCDTINAGGVFFPCENEDDAYDIFKKFDNEINSGVYVYIWGPIELHEINADMSRDMLEEIVAENHIRREIIKRAPNGCIHLHNN